jgi:hypothetical protein
MLTTTESGPEVGGDPRVPLRKRKEAALTHDIAQSLLSYNPETGLLTWKENPTFRNRKANKRGGHFRVPGAEAGCLSGKNLYISVQVNGYSYLAHRLAWLLYYGKWPTDQVDHINQCRHDNRIKNLREADNRSNHANRTDNKSGHVGVLWEKSRSKWKAYARIAYVMYNVGRYDSIEAAITARKDFLASKGIQC